MTELRLSVHDLVDLLLRTGDIDTRIFNMSTMQEGTRLHRQYQAKQNQDYFAEISLSAIYEVDDYRVIIEGKADGVYVRDGVLVIEEIKTTIADLKDFHRQNEKWHLMQAVCYADSYAQRNALKNILIKLIYIHQETEEEFVQSYEYLAADAHQDVLDLVKEYVVFHRKVFGRLKERQTSLTTLDFPFKNFRKGQRELAKYAYGVAQKQTRLYAQAPTGIGKTISTLYPFVKSLGVTTNRKIFYLTAKHSGKEAALQAITMLRERGAKISHITLTAKEKICFTPNAGCNPDECPFAKGYYDKIKDVIEESISTYEYFTYDTVVEIAKKHRICPFELSLDLSLYCDVIIGDYNYLFDPRVYLRRFFETDSRYYLALIDEAHNLVERARDMYSAKVSYLSFLVAKKKLAKLASTKLKKHFKVLSQYFNARLEGMKEEHQRLDFDPALVRLFEKIQAGITAIQKEKRVKLEDEVMDFFFDVNRWIKLAEFFGENYAYFISRGEKKEAWLELFCLDPSVRIAETLNRLSGAVLFSATLSPRDYYLPMLGSQERDAWLELPSPFPQENLCLLVAPKVSTRFKNRQATELEIALYIEQAVQAKLGNYLVFFPSYLYLKQVFEKTTFPPEVKVLLQTQEMTATQQKEFLDQFSPQPQETTIGFVVLGGAFSEGIDLMADRLIGAIIVGVGLPQLSFERDIISDYFKKRGQDGYLFSYAYPGMNKVLQAMGRVIRSETDRGMVLLIDDRYLKEDYKNVFQNQYRHYEVVLSPDDVLERLLRFWKRDAH